jgi:uncharacterized protein (DUF488 family)
MKPVLATIGYEAATTETFHDALRDAGVEVLVDVRAAARSRRMGFAKTRLRAGVEEQGLAYLHLPGLGTPAEGRSAARSGDHAAMREVFAEHLQSPAAQEQLDTLVDLVRSGRRVAIMCLEDDPSHCHRSLVADAVVERLQVRVEHLRPRRED